MMPVNRMEITVNFHSINMYEKNAKINCIFKEKHPISFISYRQKTNENISKLEKGCSLYIKFEYSISKDGKLYRSLKECLKDGDTLINLSEIKDYSVKLEEML